MASMDVYSINHSSLENNGSLLETPQECILRINQLEPMIPEHHWRWSCPLWEIWWDFDCSKCVEVVKLQNRHGFRDIYNKPGTIHHVNGDEQCHHSLSSPTRRKERYKCEENMEEKCDWCLKDEMRRCAVCLTNAACPEVAFAPIPLTILTPVQAPSAACFTQLLQDTHTALARLEEPE